MKGELRWEEVDSPSLASNPLGDSARRKLLVYVPSGYARSAARFPTVYFLHGFSGSVSGWAHSGAFTPTVPERLDRLIESGAVPPALGVFIDGWSSLGGSQWDNSEALGNYRDYVAKDVVTAIEGKFRTLSDRNARAVVGKSSGGYGALVMARHHADVFGHIGCHSGDSYFEYCYLPEFPKAASHLLKSGGVKSWFEAFLRSASETKPRSEDWAALNIVAMAAAYSPKRGAPLNLELPFDIDMGEILPAVWQRWLTRDPVRFVPESSAAFKSLQSLFIDCGTRDEFNLRWGARQVARSLEEMGAPCVYEEFEDTHGGINYRYDRSLGHLLPRMRKE